MYTHQQSQDRFHKYLRLMDWARARYTCKGILVIQRGKVFAPFMSIERLAWDKYMA